MPTCAIIGCTSGYRSNREKTHIFTVPRDPEIRELWNIAVKPSGTAIKPGKSVCEKHFNANEILWQRNHLASNGMVLGVTQYKVPRLKKGSVPSKFPWTDLIMPQKDILTKRKANPIETLAAAPLGKDAGPLVEDVVPLGEDVAPLVEDAAPLVKDAAPLRKDVVYHSALHCELTHKNSTVSPRLVTFKQLMASDISMPPRWSKQTVTHENTTFITYYITKFAKIRGKLVTFMLKEIIVKADMTFQINVLGKPVEEKDLKINVSPLRSVQKLQDLLLLLSGLCICTGTKLFDEEYRAGSAVYQDLSGTWRHVKCSLLVSSTLVCSSCRTARKSMIARSRRINKCSNARKRICLRVPSEYKSVLAKLKVKYRNAEKIASRAKAEIAKLKSTIDEYQKKMLNSAKSLDQFFESTKVRGNQMLALREIVAVAKCEGSRGRRYSEEWLLFCMLLHMRSPAGYNFLRKNEILPLPDIRTIRRHLSSIDTTCGFDSRFFEILKLTLTNKDEIQKHGILLIDEMATRESVNIATKTLSYKGLIDFGKVGEQASDLNEKANHGLVIIFQPLFDDYTQPIAVFASLGPVTGDVLAKLIVKAIVLFENAGAKVHGVVTDGASTNRKFWSEMGISGQKTNVRNSFEHPVAEGRRVFVFSDTPHLIKTIRNRLYSKKILQMDPTESPIKWDDIKILHKKDKELATPSQVLMCPKLSSNHFMLNNSSKTRVRLAVQVFSNTVACGLRFFKRYVPELEDSEGTAAFCEWINKMFDALNRKDDIEGVQPANIDFKILEDSIRKLDAWEENVEKGLLSKDLFLTPQTAEGLRVTLKSTLDIVTYLTNHCNFPYVLTGRINQDPIEKYFGTVRQAGDCNDHPLSYTFLQIHKILSMFSILKPPKTRNCGVSRDKPHQPHITLSELKTIYGNSRKSDLLRSIIESLSNAARHDSWDFEDIIEHDYSKPEVLNCVMYYITANLAKQIMNTIKCAECKQALLSSENGGYLPESTITNYLMRIDSSKYQFVTTCAFSRRTILISSNIM